MFEINWWTCRFQTKVLYLVFWTPIFRNFITDNFTNVKQIVWRNALKFRVFELKTMYFIKRKPQKLTRPEEIVRVVLYFTQNRSQRVLSTLYIYRFILLVYNNFVTNLLKKIRHTAWIDLLSTQNIVDINFNF